MTDPGQSPCPPQPALHSLAPTVQELHCLHARVGKQSAKSGTSTVIVCCPWEDTYELHCDVERRETTARRCVLVRADDTTVCSNGECKHTARSHTASASHVRAYHHGATLVMSAVPLAGDTTPRITAVAAFGPPPSWRRPHTSSQLSTTVLLSL